MDHEIKLEYDENLEEKEVDLSLVGEDCCFSFEEDPLKMETEETVIKQEETVVAENDRDKIFPDTEKPTEKIISQNMLNPAIQLRRINCDYCCETFKTYFEFNSHLTVHTTDLKDFQGNIGGKMFGLLTGESEFVCNVCEKSFVRLYNLKKHELTHTGENPFVCNVCERTFLQLDHLRNHERSHRDKTRLVCNVCKKSFLRSDHFKRHERIHIGGKPFVCDICGKSIARYDNFKKHKEKHIEKQFLGMIF